MKNILKKIIGASPIMTRAGLSAVMARAGLAICVIAVLDTTIFTGCSDLNSKSSENSASYTVKGSVSISGAAPSALLPSANASRTATSSFSDNGAAWTIRAYASESYTESADKPGTYIPNESATAIEATNGGDENAAGSFSFAFEDSGTYLITADYFDSNKVAVFSGQKVVDVTNEPNSDWITITASMTNEKSIAGYGSINLEILSYPSDDVASVSLAWLPESATYSDEVRNSWITNKLNEGELNYSAHFEVDEENGTYKKAKLEISNLYCGEHAAILSFYDSNGELIYVCTELFNIYPGFTTDTWYGTSPNITSGGEFHIWATSSLKRIGDLDAPIVLWNLVEPYEKTLLLDENESNGLTTDTMKSYALGVQPVGYIKKDMEISEPVLDISAPLFCFGNNGYIYAYDSRIETIQRLRKDYVYVLDSSFSLSMANLTSSMTGLTFSDLTAISYYDGKLYIGFSMRNNNYVTTYYLGTIDVTASTPTLLYSDVPNSILTLAATDGAVYYEVFNSSTYVLHKKTVELTDTQLSGGETSQTYELSEENLGVNFINAKAQATDFCIIGDKLYVSLCAYNDATSSTSYRYFKNADNTYSFKAAITSTGGILQFALSDTDFTPSEWSNDEKILGWYTGTCYTVDNDDPTKYLAASVTMQPPEENEGSYFYGAKKFIAKREDELVIADDGGYIDVDVDSTSQKATKVNAAKNKNRVVTVNLGDESLSAVDVNVAFSSTITLGTGYGIR